VELELQRRDAILQLAVWRTSDLHPKRRHKWAFRYKRPLLCKLV